MRRATLVGPFAAALVFLLIQPAQAVPVSFRGVDCDALGSATALIWSPRSNVAELRCSNIGSSGQDGVSVALPSSTGAWQCVFGPMPDGMLPPEELEVSLYELAAGTPADGTVRWHTDAGRVQCTLECPGATEYVVRIWDDQGLVFSGTSISPPVVELPPGAGACEPGSSFSASTGEAVIDNLRQRVLDLESKLVNLGLLRYSGTDFQGRSFSIVAVGSKVKEVRKAELRAIRGVAGGGGGGAGGFSVSNHCRRFGIGVEQPSPPLGLSVSDGSVLSSPSPGVTRVALGGGAASWRATYSDLSSADSPLHCWGVDFAEIPLSAFTGAAQLECRVPSLWTSGPDTLRVLVLDDGSGTGPALRMINADAKLHRVAAYSGSSLVALADGTGPASVDVPLVATPTGFHVMRGNGEVLMRCPMPAGATVMSGGMLYPCDSIEVRISGGPDDDCDGILACTLAGRQVDHCDLRFANMLHMHQHGRRGGVSVSATGGASIGHGGGGGGGAGGGLTVSGMSVLGGDGALFSGAGGALRVILKEYFETGDKPTQQQFTAVIDSRFASVADGDEVSTLSVVHAHGTGGSFRTSFKVHAVHRGEGRLFVQLSDGTFCLPEECDDDGDGFMDVRHLMGGATSMIGSVGYRRDSPWTECFDVDFRAPVTIAVRGEDRYIIGLRVWRNRGGEHIGTPAPPVAGLRLNGLPPGVPVLGPQGVCDMELDGVEFHTAGSGVEAHGPGSSIDGFPVVETWSALADSGGTDCDDDDSGPGVTLVARGTYHPVVIDKKFPPPSPGGPVHRGVAFTADLGPATSASDSAGFTMVLGGSIGGAPEAQLVIFGGKKGYDYYKTRGSMASAQSNPLYVECFSGGAPTAAFLQTDSMAFTHPPGAAVCVGDYGGEGRLAIVLSGFAPGTMVHPPGGGPDQDCDRVVITPGGLYDAASLDGTCAVTLNGLPPGVPVTGVRLAAIPFADPSLAVGPGAPVLVFALSRPWPNPAHGALRAGFSLPAAAQVRARVYDVGGRAVATLADARFAAGEHTLAWDGRLAGGAPAPAGLYFLRVTRDGRDARVARFTQLR